MYTFRRLAWGLLGVSVFGTLAWIPLALDRGNIVIQQNRPASRTPQPSQPSRRPDQTTGASGSGAEEEWVDNARVSHHHGALPNADRHAATLGFTKSDILSSLQEVWSQGLVRPLVHAAAEEAQGSTPRPHPSTVYVHPELAGGLNNQRICLINAVAIAILKNLTLVLPQALNPFVRKGGSPASAGQIEQASVPLSRYFDVHKLQEDGVLRLAHALPKGVQKRRVKVGKLTSRTGYREVSSRIDTATSASTSASAALSTKYNYIKLRCQFAVDWAGQPSSHTASGGGDLTPLDRVVLYALRSVSFSQSSILLYAAKAKRLLQQPAGGVNATSPRVGVVRPQQKQQQGGEPFSVVHIRAEADWAMLRADGLKKILGASFDPLKIPGEEISAALSAVQLIEEMRAAGRASPPSGPPKKHTWVVAGGISCADPTLVSAVRSNRFLSEHASFYCLVGDTFSDPMLLGEEAVVSKKAKTRSGGRLGGGGGGGGGGVAFSSELGMKPGSMSYVKAAVDQTLGVAAEVFIGRKESSFASFISYERRNRGFMEGLQAESVLSPSFLYLPGYERSFKAAVDATDIDVTCFGYPCTVKSSVITNAQMPAFPTLGLTTLAPLWLASEDLSVSLSQDIETCLLTAGRALRPGVLDSSGTSGGLGGCGLTPLFAVLDARLMLPLAITHTVTRGVEGLLHESRPGLTPRNWLGQWLPPYIWNTSVEVVGDRLGDISVLFATWDEVRPGGAYHASPVHEVFVACGVGEAAVRCVSDLASRRARGQFAHRLWKL
eukprot:TRINITY_DN18346_c1_g1_i1.p1 TRINITY_DN18346_c1_g1~~TRINITY_DN18346_c1_g1_i1.p1  ORF type:complete len:778 (+),score=191.60 TRINITY_DN18346_c1_g1_i1:62-2395(+)